ncbi:MAG: methylenetetrahydrofolate reductase [Dehalococcoidales bacterium]|nr:methylenetetrahydrofolate reductase [Dehalococcoidales bacterium]
MSKLKDKLQQGQFVVTGEIAPPKGANLDACLSDADKIKPYVTAVNVTDQQSAVMKMGSLAVSSRLIQNGIEPVFQLTCRDRNRLGLQSDLLSAAALGIENVLCITGDHPVLGDHGEAKPVYDLDSVQLIKAASGLNDGHDLAGHDLDSSPNLFIGAVVTPALEPVEPQIIKMKKKIDAGAKFFQTQAIYEPEKFVKFMDSVKGYNVPVIAGLVLLKSAAMAKFMNANVAGIVVPDAMIEELEATDKADRKKKSVEIAARIIEQIKPVCQGVHIMPLGWDELVPEVIQAAGLN